MWGKKYLTRRACLRITSQCSKETRSFSEKIWRDVYIFCDCVHSRPQKVCYIEMVVMKVKEKMAKRNLQVIWGKKDLTGQACLRTTSIYFTSALIETEQIQNTSSCR